MLAVRVLNGGIEVTCKECPVCGGQMIGLFKDVLVPRFNAWQNGEGDLQDLLPELNENDREALISGTCPECWDAIFGEPE